MLRINTQLYLIKKEAQEEELKEGEEYRATAFAHFLLMHPRQYWYQVIV
jgi:hypothetical protein